MNYELVYKLKEAGFDQREDLLLSAESVSDLGSRCEVALAFQRDGVGHHKTFDYSIYPIPDPDDWTQGRARASSMMSREYLNSEEGKKYTVYYPTTSELLEACRDHIKVIDTTESEKAERITVFQADEKLLGNSKYAIILKDWKYLDEALARVWLRINS